MYFKNHVLVDPLSPTSHPPTTDRDTQGPNQILDEILWAEYY